MQQTDEHTGQDVPYVPYWSYLDIGLFFMVPTALGVLLRLAVHFRFLPRTEFVTPSVSLQLSVIAILVVALYSILRLRYHRPVWTSLGWTFPRVRHSLVAVLFGPLFAVLVVMSARVVQILSAIPGLISHCWLLSQDHFLRSLSCVAACCLSCFPHWVPLSACWRRLFSLLHCTAPTPSCSGSGTWPQGLSTAVSALRAEQRLPPG
jgi:hypothetical protein